MEIDKNDLQMEDAEMQSQGIENNEQGLDKNQVDADVKPETAKLPPSDEQKSSVLEQQHDGVMTEVEDQKKDQDNGTNGANVESKAENEEGDQCNANVEGKREAKDDTEQNNDANNEIEDKCDPMSEAGDSRNAENEVKNQTNADDQSEPRDDSESQNIDKGDLKDVIMGEKDEAHLIENGKEGNLTGSEALKDKEPNDDAAKVEALSENAQLPDKPLTKQGPQDNKGGITGVAHDGENEISQNGNEMGIDEKKEPEDKTASGSVIDDKDARLGEASETKKKVDYLPINFQEPVTPHALMKCSTPKSGQDSGEMFKNKFGYVKMDDDDDDDGTPEDQAAFMREIESFYREKSMDFKPPRFYGQPLNCLKLWKAVIRLGGYDRVTGSKLWRQVGESFNPPKTCTTVSWTFRIFYEKALLEYERHKTQTGELQLSIVSLPDSAGVDNEGNGHQASGSGRARRDAAARAMQGWHEQRLLRYGEVGEPIIKDKNLNSMTKREKNLKSIGSLKQKRTNEVELPVKAARTEMSKQLVTTVVDVGPPADWVKINVRETKDCFEVYALVPGLLREEVRVQSDPAGRLVITGQPEHLDNPWGITAFKKVVSLPARIDPLQTSAVVSLHGRLFALLEYERHKTQTGELQLSIVSLPDSAGVDNEGNGHQASGSGRARRDAAARAMQGWHEQRLLRYGEVGEPIIKDKNLNSMTKREKNLKSIGSLKQKRTNEVELPVKAARTEMSKQLVTTVVDVGPPADWVKINVRETKDCFEVYALVPGLLREEVRVQSDPAGRLVITGQPEHLDNPWGITAFKKVVSLPARIDPLQTSAVVSLHGRLFVRVPFEQSNI